MLETANNKAVDANASQRNSVVLLAMTDQDTAAFVYPKNTFVTTSLNSCDALVTSGLSLPDPENIISTLRWQMEGATNAQSPGSGVNQLSSYVFNKGTTRITYQGTTRNNNPIYCTFTLTVRDNQAPRLVFSPGNITVSNSTGKCYARVNWTEPIVADNCVATENLIIKSNYKPGDEFPVGETKVEYRISDGLNETIHSFLVTVVDREAPELTAPETIVVVCGEEVEDAFTSWKQFEQAGGKVSDNCAVDFESFRYVRQIASAIRCPYTITRTYSIADVGGNVTEVKHLIKVLGESMVSETKEKAEESQLLLKAGAVNQAEIAFLKTDVTCKGGNDGTVKLTVSGTSGALSYVWLTSNGNGIVQGRKDQTTLSDGEYTVRIFEDGDLLLEFDFSILVSDNEAPHITAPENITLDCGQTIPAAYSIWSEFANAGGAVWDNCRIYYSSFRLASESKSNPDCPYTLTRTYEITDINGNRGYAEHLITVEAGEVVLKSGAGTAGTITARATGDWNLASTWDCNCVPDFEDDVIIPSGFTVTVDAAAECNNITIETGGTLDHSGATTLQVYGNWTNNGIYSSGSGTIEFTGSADAVIGGSSTTSFNNFILNKGSDVTTDLTVKTDITITDLTFENGVLDIESGTTDIADIVNPNNTIPSTAGIRISGGTLTTGYYSIINEGLIEVTSGSATFGTGSGNSVHIQTDGAFIVTGGTVDIAGRLENTAGGTLSGYPSGINISGGIITLATAGNNESGTGSLDVTTSGAFNFTGGTIIFENPSTAGAALDLGLIDGTGNGTKIITNGIFQFGNNYTPNGSIFHIDSEIKIPHIDTYLGSALFLDIPMNGTFTVECIDQATEPTPPEVLDNCGYEISPTGPVIGGSFNGCSGTRSYTYTYEDCDGSKHEWGYVYTIDDTEPPVFDAVTPFTSLCSSATFDADIQNWLNGVTATDNCGEVTITHDYDVADLPETGCGSITITFTATDECANSVTTSSTIELTDNIAPVFAAVTPFTSLCSSATLDADIQNWLNGVTATDNCGDVTITNDYDVADLPETGCGSITITFTAVDECANSVTTSSTITLSDNVPPVFDAVTPFTSLCSSATLDADIQNWLDGVSATDNCGEVTITNDYDVANLPKTGCGSITITFTATDECANSVTISSTIELTDNIAPVFDAITPFTSLCSSDTLDADIQNWLNGVTATDNCGEVTITNDYDVADLPETGCGSITITFTATDECANSVTTSSTIELTDNVPPVFDAVTPFTSLCSSATLDADIQNWLNGVTATDNCGDVTITNDYDVADLPATGCGSITITFTATDECANSVTTSSTIELTDNIAPVLAAITPFTSLCSSATLDADIQNWLNGVTATDNCGEVTITHDYDVADLPATGCGSITITFTATDECANSVTTSSTITLSDNVPPVFDAITPFTSLCSSATLDADIQNWLNGVTATDNCGEVSITNDYDVANLPATGCGSITITFTATDECANSVTTSSTIELTDNVAPVFDAITPFSSLCSSATLDADIQNWLNGVTATDNCGEVTITHDYDVADLPETGCGSITITFTAVDECANSVTTSSTITLTDNVPPVFDAVTPFSSLCSSATLDADIQNWLNGVTATDNCGEVTITHDYDVADLPGTGCGDITITFTATDECVNSVTTSSTIELTDNIAPVFAAITPFTSLCSSATLDADIQNWLNGVTATDNCGEVTITHDYDVADLPATGCGSITITFTATDECTNSVTTSSTIELTDNVPPVFDAVTPFTSLCSSATLDADIQNWLNGVTATDNCGDVTITNDYDVADLPETGCGSITITFTATDECANSVTTSSTIELTDNIAPVFAAITPFTSLCSSATLDADIQNWLNGVTATDNCGEVTITNDYDVADLPETGCGSITITFTATDECANSVTTSNTITLTDNVPPVFDAVTPFTSLCSSATLDADIQSWLNGVAATDNCGEVTITNDYDVADLPETGCGSITITFTATDECANSVTTNSTITLTDNVPPVFDAVTPFTSLCSSATLDADIQSWLNGVAATDNCGEVTITNDYDVADLPETGCGSITITFTATDECANSVTTNSTITLTDNVPPVFAAITPFTSLCSSATLDADIQNWLNGVTATDNCGEVTITHDYDVADLPATGCGSITITFTATDECANSVTTNSTIELTDNIAPVFAAITPFTSLCSSATLDADIQNWLNGVTATDNCGDVTITNDYDVADLPETGCWSITITFTATDECANSVTTSSTIELTDNIAPTASNPPPINVECTADVPEPDITVVTDEADNCTANPVVAHVSDVSNGGFNPEVITRTYSITDDCGNSINVEQIITIDDVTPPDVQCKPLVVQLDAAGNATINPDQIDNGSNDNCTAIGDLVFALDITDFDCDDLGDNIVTLTVTDKAGNSESCTATVTVEDNINPTANCREITIQLNSSGTAVIAASDIDYGSSDNCSIKSVTIDKTIFSCEDVGDNTVTLTVTDASGNSSTCEGTVTVEDKTKPIAICKNFTVQLDETGNASITAADIDKGSYDACGIASRDLDRYDFTCEDLGTNAVTLTVTDNNGNQSSCPAVVTVIDNLPPTASAGGNATICIDETHTVSGANANNGTIEWTHDGNGTLTNSNSLSPSYTSVLADAGNTVTLTLTVTGNNACGNNTATASYLVDVNPVATVNPIAAMEYCEGETTPAVALSSNLGAAVTFNITGGQDIGLFNKNNVTEIPSFTANAGTRIVTITPVYNGCPGEPLNVEITVNPTPSVSASPLFQTICSGEETAILLGSNLAGSTFNWTATVDPAGSVSGVADGVNESTNTITQTLVNNTFSEATVTYRIYAENGDCPGAAMDIVVKVKPGLTAGITGDATVCQEDPEPNIIFTVNGGTAPYIFTYTINDGANQDVELNAGNTIDVPVPTDTDGDFTYKLVSVYEASGCTHLFNETATVTVSPKPYLSSTLTPTGVCSNNAFAYTPASATTGTTFSWSRAAIAGIDNPAETGTDAIDEFLINTTNAPIPVVYTYTLEAAGCTNTQDVVVMVTPTPSLTSTLNPDGVCSESLFSYTPTSDVSETTFPWTRAAVTGISNPAAAGTGDINEVLINTTDNPVAVTYEYTLTSNDCINQATYSVVVVVTPAPEVTASADVSCVCPGGTFNLTSFSDISGGTPLPGTLLAEDFNGSASGWTTTNTSTGGDPSDAAWTLRPNNYNFSISWWNDVTFRSNDYSQFYLSNSREQGTSGWWGDYYTRTTLESPVFSTVGYSSLELDFYHYYEDNGGDYANIEVSTDGANWTQVRQFNSDRGSSTNFRHETIDLTAYISQPTLYIRFRYEATEDYYWAIDNITLTGESTGGAVDVSWESFNEDFSSSFGEFSILANPTNVTIHEPTQFVVTYVDPDTNCPGRDTVFVDICETPDPVIAPDYCAYEGRVLLTAYGGADGASYSWVDSNGDVVGTDQELIVDIVDVYTLTITNPNGCSATTQLTVSNELIINGDFEAGNTGFSSDYSFVEPYLNNPPDDAPRDGTPWSSLWPEGLYGVGTNARHYHTNFWGRQDHTSGSGYFMIVNGNVNAGTPIWEQTVNVQPNTNYYFSAWAMSLNSAGNDAVLQFEVNEVLVGSLARLNRGTGNNSNNGWVRFYSEPNWNSGNVSGPITVRIRNVEPAAGGNDFALDDISFGTFDPFPLEIDVAFDDVCEGDTLFLYSNSQYGKEPITYSWTGPDGWTSNEPNPFIPNFSSANAGKYKLEALDGYGCEILPDSTDVPFNAAPVANAGPDDFVCTANPVVNLNGTIGGSATSGYWTGGGGTFDDATKPDAIYTLSQAEIDAGIAELILSTDDPAGVCEAYRDTLYITIHNSLEITTSSTTPDCHGRENGLATVTVSVPTVGPYTYLWSDGQTTPTARNLSAGTYTVTVTDANGCTASEEVIVDEPDLFVISATSPIITAPSCYGANDGSATMEVTGGTAPYTFIWDAATGDQRTATASNLAAGTYTVLVTDANGCSAATFTATIPNPPPPTLNCPEDLEGLVDPASCTVTFGDIEEPMMDGYCTTTLTYELSGATTGSGTGSVNGQVDFNVGLTTVKYKIEDTAGNKDSCTFTVLAKHLDLDPTIYSCPPATVHAGAPDSYLCYKTVALDAVELDDDCNEIESIWHDSPYSSDPSDASGDYPVGTTNFSWYIRDVSGNIKTCDVTVIVDDLGPQITCPADVSEEIAANECSKTGVTINPPEYRDNCPNAELSYVLSGATTGSGMGVVPSYQVFNIGVTTVTYTVTDVNNNTAECSFTVTIERLSIPPAVIICPDSPDPVTAVAGTCFAPVTVAAPVINDPCATTNYTIINDFNHTDNASDSYPVGTTTVNWTITDNSGKTYTCVQEVIVEDLPPTIDCPDNYTFLADENVDYKDNVTLDYPTYADNCPNPIVEWTRVEPNGTITQSSSAGINFIPNPGRYYIGVTTITYKITDLSGLTDDCSFTVTVTGPPDITCPPVYETTTDPGVCTATRSSDDYGLPTLNEGVQPITWIWTIYNPDGTVGATNSATPFVGSAANPGPPAIPDYAFKRGTSTITWHVENISGFDECSYEVIVTDKEPPTLDADPYENCVDPLHWAVYNPSNPNPVFNHTNANLEKFPVDYRTLYAEDTSLDLTSLKDNCCDSTEMTIHWRIEFSDTPDPQDGTWVSHDAISGTGQPSTYVHPTTGVPTDIYLWGDGVTFQPVVHRIYYWVIDCNGNQSETVEKTITILPRPQIIKMNY
ncbi:HYR domain-containing protein [Draconibacterium orientale]|uniref:HYR-like domain-containing protein n=1 Tax=Draconibacterium orientale TaxID=1168034 RepID=UPI002ABD6668|nr:HYR domain-containing protein [Draconibacterium orientale]